MRTLGFVIWGGGKAEQGMPQTARLKYIPNIVGVLVGRALFRKTVDLGQTLAMAQPQPEAVAELI